jgi:hypothetical protein
VAITHALLFSGVREDEDYFEYFGNSCGLFGNVRVKIPGDIETFRVKKRRDVFFEQPISSMYTWTILSFLFFRRKLSCSQKRYQNISAKKATFCILSQHWLRDNTNGC